MTYTAASHQGQTRHDDSDIRKSRKNTKQKLALQINVKMTTTEVKNAHKLLKNPGRRQSNKNINNFHFLLTFALQIRS